jgi:hypothetical protein
VPIALRWAKGGEATFVSIDGERVVLSSSTSAPPGAYVDGTLNDGTTLRIKVRGCVVKEERFIIEARILDLSRALRELLRSQMSGGG